jgi:hypothetical protein
MVNSTKQKTQQHREKLVASGNLFKPPKFTDHPLVIESEEIRTKTRKLKVQWTYKLHG